MNSSSHILICADIMINRPRISAGGEEERDQLVMQSVGFSVVCCAVLCTEQLICANGLVLSH